MAGALAAVAVIAGPSAAGAATDPCAVPGAIIGTPGNDVRTGTPGNDVICGRGGNDVLRGLGGIDVLVGGPGADTIDGGTGDDTLIGDEGSDTLLGGDGHDRLHGYDRTPDTVLCGVGTSDYGTYDMFDTARSCETGPKCSLADGGPAIAGPVVVRAADCRVSNVTINGDVVVAPGIRAEFDNVTVHGNLTTAGGVIVMCGGRVDRQVIIVGRSNPVVGFIGAWSRLSGDGYWDCAPLTIGSALFTNNELGPTVANVTVLGSVTYHRNAHGGVEGGLLMESTVTGNVVATDNGFIRFVGNRISGSLVCLLNRDEFNQTYFGGPTHPNYVGGRRLGGRCASPTF